MNIEFSPTFFIVSLIRSNKQQNHENFIGPPMKAFFSNIPNIWANLARTADDFNLPAY
jgi:hypothetical protein